MFINDIGGSASSHLVTMLNGSVVVANWDDGSALVALKSKVIAINSWPFSTTVSNQGWNATGDGGRLLANALTFQLSFSTLPSMFGLFVR